MFHHKKILLVFLLFFTVQCVPFPKQRCTKTDCSDQIHPFQNGSCRIIHNTTACTNSMSNFIQSPEVKLKYEEDARFSVAVIPYVAEIYASPITLPLSAINITFTIHKEGVSALAVKLIKQNMTKEETPPCRIFDFQGFENSFVLPANVFYDCFYNMNDFRNIRMDFIALPANEQLSYYTYVPPVPTSYPINNICDWQPVIMVFSGRLFNGVVAVKFSQSPQHFNIPYYSVELISNSSRTFSKIVPSENDINMISVKFSFVDTGYYSVIVKPLLDGVNCYGTEFGTFKVEYSKRGVVVEVIAVCIILLLAVCGCVCYKCSKNTMQLKGKRALLFASHDCSTHKDFIDTVVSYFTHKCHLRTSTVYGDDYLLDPHHFIMDKYHESDIIIFLISEGLLITLQKLLIQDHKEDPRQLKEFHPWKGQLQNATRYIISGNAFRKKKICKIIFPYARELDIPKQVDLATGVSFQLPKHLNNFLNFVYDCHPAIPCLYPTLSEDLKSSEKGRELLEKLSLVQNEVEFGKHLEFEPDAANNNNNNMKFCSNTSSSSSINDSVNEASSSKVYVGNLHKLYKPNTSSSSSINSSVNEASSSKAYVKTLHAPLLDNKSYSSIEDSEDLDNDTVSQYSDVSGLNSDQSSSSVESLVVLNFLFNTQSEMNKKQFCE